MPATSLPPSRCRFPGPGGYRCALGTHPLDQDHEEGDGRWSTLDTLAYDVAAMCAQAGPDRDAIQGVAKSRIGDAIERGTLAYGTDKRLTGSGHYAAADRVVESVLMGEEMLPPATGRALAQGIAEAIAAAEGRGVGQPEGMTAIELHQLRTAVAGLPFGTVYWTADPMKADTMAEVLARVEEVRLGLYEEARKLARLREEVLQLRQERAAVRSFIGEQLVDQVLARATRPAPPAAPVVDRENTLWADEVWSAGYDAGASDTVRSYQHRESTGKPLPDEDTTPCPYGGTPVAVRPIPDPSTD